MGLLTSLRPWSRRRRPAFAARRTGLGVVGAVVLRGRGRFGRDRALLGGIPLRPRGSGYGVRVDVLRERPAVETRSTQASPAQRRVRGWRRVVIVSCVVVVLAALTAWLWNDPTSRPAAYVVGDSITALRVPSISAAPA